MQRTSQVLGALLQMERAPVKPIGVPVNTSASDVEMADR
jgi:hypothetical protein